jgi:SAM-dependent methyltransferase
MSTIRVTPSAACCNEQWEAAYRRFETPEEETAKFTRRLRAGGSLLWDRKLRIVELFCGRGNGLVALERLGFQHLEGVDLSSTLLSEYSGSAQCYVADCRDLPFANSSKDVVVIQGGLHHLPELPGDLEQVLEQVQRVLVPGGRVMFVEPWRTMFLDIVHIGCKWTMLRRCWQRLDALAVMIAHESETYFRWLAAEAQIEISLRSHFEPRLVRKRFGKLLFCGTKR